MAAGRSVASARSPPPPASRLLGPSSPPSSTAGLLRATAQRCLVQTVGWKVTAVAQYKCRLCPSRQATFLNYKLGGHICGPARVRVAPLL